MFGNHSFQPLPVHPLDRSYNYPPQQNNVTSTQGLYPSTQNSNFSHQQPAQDYAPGYSQNVHPSSMDINTNDDENEPPILEELGIDFTATVARLKSAILFKKIDHGMLADSDLSGPMVIALALGLFLLLAGKIHFGYIYGLTIVGATGMYLLLNLMSSSESIDLYRTLSILGYGLSPIVILAAISVIFSLKNVYGIIITLLLVVWSTTTSTRFFDVALSLKEQKFLVAYPVLLLYACFAIVTVF